MKISILILIVLISSSFRAQKTSSIVVSKTQSFDEVYSGKHTLVSAKKHPKYGWEVTMILNSKIKIDSNACFEVLRADSTIYYAFVIFPEYEIASKGMRLMQMMEITGDSIAPTDRFAPIGTYTDFYPKKVSTEAHSSITFLDAAIPNSTTKGFLLPDFTVLNGAVHIGDEVEMTDKIGRKCTAKIEVIELECIAYGASNNSLVQYVVPEFNNEKKFNVSVIYSKLSGEDLGENITIKK